MIMYKILPPNYVKESTEQLVIMLETANRILND